MFVHGRKPCWYEVERQHGHEQQQMLDSNIYNKQIYKNKKPNSKLSLCLSSSLWN